MSDTTHRNRVHAGVREGGQFVTEAKAETDVTLAPGARCIICDDDTAAGQSMCGPCEEVAAQHPAPEPEPDAAADLPDPARLAAMTPVEVDTELAQAMAAGERALRKVTVALLDGRSAAGLPSRRWGEPDCTREEVVTALERILQRPETPDWQVRTARRALDAIAEADAMVAACRAEITAYDAEWARRGHWSRAFLVTGGDGHVHSSMSCSTCNRGNSRTQFQFMTEFSGKDEADIVAAAGWRACTVCYPSAPVGTKTSLPTSMWSKEEQDKAAAKAEREAKKAAREAAKIAKAATPDGSVLRVEWTARNAPVLERDPATGKLARSYRDQVEQADFATERSAVQWYLDEHVYYSGTAKEADQAPAYAAIEEALAAKHGKTPEQMRAELQAKVDAKRRREGY